MTKLLDLIMKIVRNFMLIIGGKKESPPASDPPPAQEPDKVPSPPTTELPRIIIAPRTEEDYAHKYAMAKIPNVYLGQVMLTVRAIEDSAGRYKAVELANGLPWEMVAAIHSLESGLNFKSVLHNGEAIIGTGKKTSLVPKGRGPFANWEDAAIDALGGQGRHKGQGWPIGRALTFLEAFNGRGYSRRGLDSPYIWNMTTEQRTRGKFVADGVFDEKAISRQVGCAAILKALKFA